MGNSFLKNNKKQNAVLVNNNIENISNSIIKIIYNTYRKMIIKNSHKLLKKYSNIMMFNNYNKLIKILLNEQCKGIILVGGEVQIISSY